MRASTGRREHVADRHRLGRPRRTPSETMTGYGVPGRHGRRQHRRRELRVARRPRHDRAEVRDVDGDELEREPPRLQDRSDLERAGPSLDLGERDRVQVRSAAPRRRRSAGTAPRPAATRRRRPPGRSGASVVSEKAPIGRRGHQHEQHRPGAPATGRAAHREDGDEVAPPAGQPTEAAGPGSGSRRTRMRPAASPARAGTAAMSGSEAGASPTLATLPTPRSRSTYAPTIARTTTSPFEQESSRRGPPDAGAATRSARRGERGRYDRQHDDQRRRQGDRQRRR